MNERGQRKELTGIVIRNKMDKTVIVQTSRRIAHKVYGKTLVQKAKYYAHDEKSVGKLGDTVRIRQTRPLSRLKRWAVVEVVRSASLAQAERLGGGA